MKDSNQALIVFVLLGILLPSAELETFAQGTSPSETLEEGYFYCGANEPGQILPSPPPGGISPKTAGEADLDMAIFLLENPALNQCIFYSSGEPGPFVEGGELSNSQIGPVYISSSGRALTSDGPISSSTPVTSPAGPLTPDTDTAPRFPTLPAPSPAASPQAGTGIPSPAGPVPTSPPSPLGLPTSPATTAGLPFVVPWGELTKTLVCYRVCTHRLCPPRCYRVCRYVNR